MLSQPATPLSSERWRRAAAEAEAEARDLGGGGISDTLMADMADNQSAATEAGGSSSDAGGTGAFPYNP